MVISFDLGKRIQERIHVNQIPFVSWQSTEFRAI